MDTSFILIGLQQALTLQNIFLIALGTAIGIIVGALPGLSATMALALLLPITFPLAPDSGLAMLAALYLSAMYGGSIAAIILRTPGTPAAAATVMDGYPMGARGEAGKALGFSLTASMVGGLISGLALLTVAPMLGSVVLMFGPLELFAIATLGITMIGTLSRGSAIKGLFSGALGLLLAMVGMDPMTGSARFVFDNINLYSGISYTVALIGMFSIPQAIALAQEAREEQAPLNKIGGRVLPSIREFIVMLPNALRSGLIGIVVGVLPGSGGETASWFAYNEAKRWAKPKDKDKFGTGYSQGIVAPEAANNAVVGGALVPTIALGIPGSSTTAVMLGALMVHGILPGPTLLTDHGDITYTLIWAVILANIPLFFFGLAMTRVGILVTRIPKMIVAVSIVVLAIVGTLAINNNMFDVWLMLGFGLIGYIFDRANIPVAPIVIGLVLGMLLDTSLAQSMIIGHDSWSVFTRSPLAMGILVVAGLSILQATPIFRLLFKRKVKKAG